MSAQHPAFIARRCPSCAAAVGPNQLVCPSCGSVLAIEDAAQIISTSAGRALIKTVNGLRHDALLWILALTPLLIIPPILAILLRHRDDRATQSPITTETKLLYVVAALNIIASAFFWRWLGETAVDAALSIWRHGGWPKPSQWFDQPRRWMI